MLISYNQVQDKSQQRLISVGLVQDKSQQRLIGTVLGASSASKKLVSELAEVELSFYGLLPTWAVPDGFAMVVRIAGIQHH